MEENIGVISKKTSWGNLGVISGLSQDKMEDLRKPQGNLRVTSG